MTGRRFLFLIPASFGYLFPAIRLAHGLQRRGHQVHAVVAAEFAHLLTLNGIPHEAITNSASEFPFLFPGHWFQAPRNAEQVPIFQRIVERWQPDVVVTSPLTLSGFLVAEINHLPVVIVGFSEYLYPGLDDEESPRRWRLGEFTTHYNTVRSEFALPSIEEDAAETPLLGDLFLLRSTPEMLGDLRTPDQVLPIGSALYWDPPVVHHGLDRFLERARQRGRPVLHLQVGRLFEGRYKWPLLVEALAGSPYDVVADVGREDYLEARSNFPENFHVDTFIPFGSVAREAFCILSTSQSASFLGAIVHGLPQLSMPYSDDARETALKTIDRGLGLAIFDDEGLEPARLEASLETLRRGESYREAALAHAELFARYGEEERLLSAVESVRCREGGIETFGVGPVAEAASGEASGELASVARS